MEVEAKMFTNRFKWRKSMDTGIVYPGLVLETPRLLLRAWEMSDLLDMYAYASVEGVGEMAGWPHHESLEESAKILQLFIENQSNFAIEDKSTGHVIGSVGLHKSWASDIRRFQDERLVEIGYVLAKAAWGQGLMPEAAAAVIDWLFTEKDVDIITVAHMISNTRSERVIRRLGFTYIQTADRYAPQLKQTFTERCYLMRRPA